MRSRTFRPGSEPSAASTKEAGVKEQRVHQPIDDNKYIYIELDFDTAEEAEAFKGFLETKVWSSADASPALSGAPRARVLTEVSTPE